MIIALLTGQALNIWQLVGTVLVMLGVMSSGGFLKLKALHLWQNIVQNKKYAATLKICT